MNDAKRNRLALRRRLERAQYVIYRRLNYPPGAAHKMAKDKVNLVCKQTRESEKGGTN